MSAAINSTTWEDIELAESFLVCCMFEKALSKSSSVLQYVKSLEHVEKTQLLQVMEAVGMVVVQSLKELGRSRDIMKELVLLFGEATTIPVDVLLTGFSYIENDFMSRVDCQYALAGCRRFRLNTQKLTRLEACIQILEAPAAVESLLGEYLSKWRCVNENHYVLEVEATCPSYATNSDGALTLEKYMELVELYVVVLLGKVLNTIDAAIAWVKKAEIPETKREDLLRKLASLYSCKRDSTVLLSQSHKQELNISSQNGLQVLDGSSEVSKTEGVSKQSVLKLSSGVKPCFWFFRSVTLKFGNVKLVITTTKVLIGCLICLAVYFIKRKRQTLLRAAKKRFKSAMTALMDLWQLAFSYQVNPLAAVQPLPAAPRGS